MRAVIAAALAAVALLPFGLHASEESSDLPLRKAGLWEVKTQTDEGQGKKEQALTICIGEEMERDAVRLSVTENRSSCARYDIRKTPEGTFVDAACTYDERQVANHTELRGDFKTSFNAKVVSKTSGNAPRAQGGMPINMERTTVQEGRYLGDNCGDLQAGQAKTADGHTVTVQ